MKTNSTFVSRRQAVALASALTLAVATAAAAVGGIAHTPRPSSVATPALVSAPQAPVQQAQEVDD